MLDDCADTRLSAVAAAIAEPARARMLCCLMDGHARTNTELAMVAEVSPSTASVHLAKLREQQLVQVQAQGKHRYYRLAGAGVAAALEALMRIAGTLAVVPRPPFVSTTPERLRLARTCYDHLAGTLGVAVHVAMLRQGWFEAMAVDDGDVNDAEDYQLTDAGAAACVSLGLDLAQALRARRRFACGCLDWSERRAHLGGALGAALLVLLIRQGWLERDLSSRALAVTREGRRRFKAVFQIDA